FQQVADLARPSPPQVSPHRQSHCSPETSVGSWELLSFGGDSVCRQIIALRPTAAQPGRTCILDLASVWLGPHRMRDRAHWADAAITNSREFASRSRTATALLCAAFCLESFAFPNAMQALRTMPRHFVLFTALPRNIARNSSSFSPASHTRLGSSNDSLELTCRGWNLLLPVFGASRLKGQTSWQMSQPYTCQPIASRCSCGILPRNSMVR